MIRVWIILIAGLLSSLWVEAEEFQADYKKALSLSLEFYDAQGAGALGESWRRATWRKPSTLNDGADVDVDLSGGWFDAGDHVKFTLPMAYSATMLNWGYLEYRDGYRLANEESYFQNNIRVALDFLYSAYQDKNTQNIDDDIFYYQVGDGNADHSFWGPPELMIMARPTFSCDKDRKCSEAIAGSSAALASGALVFENNDSAYASKLLNKAKKMFEFAEKYQGNNGYIKANGFYTSYSGYFDELAWAAIWLYMATDDTNYLTKAKTYIAKAHSAIYWAHNWDNVSNGVYILLLQSGDSSYESSIIQHLNYWIGGVTYTAGGLAHLSEWGSLRYASTTAFLSFLYSDLVSDETEKLKYRAFGISQMNYILGNNPTKFTYEIALGDNYPINPHHRASHSSTTNNIDSPTNNIYLLRGALVGGPKVASDYDYKDDRRDYYRNEVTTDYNAGFTGALAKMILLNPTSSVVSISGSLDPVDPISSSSAIGTVSIVSQKTQEWSDGYCKEVVIQNSTTQPYTWEIELSDRDIYYFKDVNITKEGDKLIAKGISTNSSVQPNGRVAFMFCAGVEPTTPSTPLPTTPTTIAPSVDSTVGKLQISRVSTADWDKGYCETISVTNWDSSSIVWSFNIEVNGTIYDLWNANYTQEGSKVSVSGVSWNRTLVPNEKAEFGFCANRSLSTLTYINAINDSVASSLNNGQAEVIVADTHGDTLEVSAVTQTDWGSGYCKDIYVTNSTSSDIEWDISFEYEGTIYTIWNTSYSTSGQTLNVKGVDWNRIVSSNSTQSFGFCANR